MKTVLWIVLGILVLYVGCYALLYFGLDALGDAEQKESYDQIFISSRMHIIMGGLAMLIAPIQLHAGLRNKFLPLHKKLGYIYFVAVALSSVSGFIVAWYSVATLIGDVGFAFLAVAWFVTALMGFITIKQGNVRAHELWMLRNITLTFAAISIRIMLPILPLLFDLSFERVFDIVAWACWVPQLLLLELYLRKRRSSKKKAQ